MFLTGDDLGKGWAAYFATDRAPTAFLRFVGKEWRAVADQHLGMVGMDESPVSTPAPHYEVVELYLTDADGITGRDLRALPLGQIEAAVNQLSNAPRMATFANRTDGQLGISFPDLDLEKLGGRTPRRRRPVMRIRVPEGHKKPDSFYEAVAYRFGWLQAEGLKPAQELAEANGVPVTTVHRWIKEARRRGLMAPGQRGTRKGGQQ